MKISIRERTRPILYLNDKQYIIQNAIVIAEEN